MGNVARSKTTRGEGLVPRWGVGGAWQNPPCQLAVPSHTSGSSYLGVTAPAGMGDWYENRPSRQLQFATPANPSPVPQCAAFDDGEARVPPFLIEWRPSGSGYRQCYNMSRRQGV